MTKTARLARIAVIIELLCERFPQTFNRRGPQPLKVGIYDDALAALDGAAAPRDFEIRAPGLHEQRPLSASVISRSVPRGP